MKTIKLLFFVFFFLTISIKTYCQINKFDVGVEGSPSLIFLRGNPIIEMSNATIGFSGGLFLQYNLNKIISIRTNIGFERKGSLWEGNATDARGIQIGKTTNNMNYDYLTIPLLVRATIGNKYKFFMNAGPYFGYLLQAKSVFEMPNFYGTSDIKGQNSVDFGLSTGLGLLYPLKSKIVLSFELRNNLGLYNVSALPVINDGTIKTNSTNLIFGLAYKLGN
jgi:hypothetical protein